jgi:hypothetical protein
MGVQLMEADDLHVSDEIMVAIFLVVAFTEGRSADQVLDTVVVTLVKILVMVQTTIAENRLFGSVSVWFCPILVLSMFRSVHVWCCQCLVLSMFGSVHI